MNMIQEMAKEQQINSCKNRWAGFHEDEEKREKLEEEAKRLLCVDAGSPYFYEVGGEYQTLFKELENLLYFDLKPSSSIVYIPPQSIIHLASKASFEAGNNPLRLVTCNVQGETLAGFGGILSHIRLRESTREGLGKGNVGVNRPLWQELKHGIWIHADNDFLARGAGGTPEAIGKLCKALGAPPGIIGHLGQKNAGLPVALR